MEYGFYSDKGLPESSHGYRCPSWDPMPDGKKNVVVLGCSHTWGVGLEDDEHWVHFLSQHNTKRLRYWNLGQPGASADKIVRILYGSEKIIDPKIVIVCWPVWSRRELLEFEAESLTGDHPELARQSDEMDRQNFLKNLFWVEKYAEKNHAKAFHCFAETPYVIQAPGLNVLEKHSIANCWPYWHATKNREETSAPSLAKDGKHYGVEHHKRFTELFLERFGPKLN